MKVSGRLHRFCDPKLTDRELADFEALDLGAPNSKVADRYRGQGSGGEGVDRERADRLPSYRHSVNLQTAHFRGRSV